MASVLTGATNTFTIGGLTLAVPTNTLGTTTPVSIAGTLALQVAGGGAGTRNFTVADTLAATDLLLTARITDGDGIAANLQGITTAGSGRLELNPTVASDFSGTFTVGGGRTLIDNAGALGDSAGQQQTFTVRLASSAGTNSFTITYDGQTTAALPYSGATPPTDAAIAAALNGLSSVPAGTPITVTQTTTGTTPTQDTTYTVTFGGVMRGFNNPIMTLPAGGLVGAVTQQTAPAQSVSASGGTTVASGFTLEVAGGITLVGEALTLSGTGFGGRGALVGLGTSTIQGIVSMAAASTVGVDGSASVLTIDGSIRGAFLLTKLLPGTLTTAGKNHNTFTGLTITEGTVRLAKNVGIDAVAGGTITIGNEFGGQDADQLILDNNEQINAAVTTITVQVSGVLDLNGKTETIAQNGTATAITLNYTVGGRAHVKPGTLIIGGNVASDGDIAGGAGTGSPAMVANSLGGLFEANLDMGGTRRDFIIAPIAAPQVLAELEISGVISSGTLNKTTSAGDLLLSNVANTFAGVVNGVDTGNAIQTLTNGGAASGTFTLGYRGATTGNMAFNIDPNFSTSSNPINLQDLLAVLPTIGAGMWRLRVPGRSLQHFVPQRPRWPRYQQFDRRQHRTHLCDHPSPDRRRHDPARHGWWRRFGRLWLGRDRGDHRPHCRHGLATRRRHECNHDQQSDRPQQWQSCGGQYSRRLWNDAAQFCRHDLRSGSIRCERAGEYPRGSQFHWRVQSGRPAAYAQQPFQQPDHRCRRDYGQHSHRRLHQIRHRHPDALRHEHLRRLDHGQRRHSACHQSRRPGLDSAGHHRRRSMLHLNFGRNHRRRTLGHQRRGQQSRFGFNTIPTGAIRSTAALNTLVGTHRPYHRRAPTTWHRCR